MSYRCAACGRWGKGDPAFTQGVGILAVHYGPTCARNRGYLKAKRARLFTPRRRRPSGRADSQGVLL